MLRNGSSGELLPKEEKRLDWEGRLILIVLLGSVEWQHEAWHTMVQWCVTFCECGWSQKPSVGIRAVIRPTNKNRIKQFRNLRIMPFHLPLENSLRRPGPAASCFLRHRKCVAAAMNSGRNISHLSFKIKSGLSILNPGLGLDALLVGMFDAFHFRHEVRHVDQGLRRAVAGQDHVL